MGNAKQPDKKPFIAYVIGVIVIMLLLNTFLVPAIVRRNIKEVDYSTFLNMVANKQVEAVQLDSDYITFTDRSSPSNFYRTATFEDPQLVERLEKADCTFGRVVTETNPILAFTLSWVLPLVFFYGIGIFLSWLELVPYLMGHRQNMGPFKALRTAARITKGHRFETFVFQLSFLPWMLLNSLVVPALFVLPYRSMAMALYTRYLLELEENASRPVILPADGETPALPGAEQAPAPEAFADAEAKEVVEVVEEAPAEPAEAPAEVQEAQETPEALPEAPAEEAPEEPEGKPEPPAEEAPAAYPDLPQSWED